MALEQENAKLQKRIVKIEINNLSQKNKIAALEVELGKRPTLTELISISHANSLRKLGKRKS
jgi:hypothetical protein